MCRGAVCDQCKKDSWWGCGQHIPSVMDRIPQEKWCTCVGKDGKRVVVTTKVPAEGEDGQFKEEKKEYPPMAGQAKE